MTEVDQQDWLEQVKQGDFAKIPPSFCWEVSAEFAHLINGYTVTERLGLGSPEDVWHALSQQYDATGQWRGSVIELWSVLFLLHRSARFSAGGGEVESREDQLCVTLREALQQVDAVTHSLLVRLIAEEEDRLDRS